MGLASSESGRARGRPGRAQTRRRGPRSSDQAAAWSAASGMAAPLDAMPREAPRHRRRAARSARARPPGRRRGPRPAGRRRAAPRPRWRAPARGPRAAGPAPRPSAPRPAAAAPAPPPAPPAPRLVQSAGSTPSPWIGQPEGATTCDQVTSISAPFGSGATTWISPLPVVALPTTTARPRSASAAATISAAEAVRPSTSTTSGTPLRQVAPAGEVEPRRVRVAPVGARHLALGKEGVGHRHRLAPAARRGCRAGPAPRRAAAGPAKPSDQRAGQPPLGQHGEAGDAQPEDVVAPLGETVSGTTSSRSRVTSRRGCRRGRGSASTARALRPLQQRRRQAGVARPRAALPSTASSRSPRRMPACAAGPPGVDRAHHQRVAAHRRPAGRARTGRPAAPAPPRASAGVT